MAKGSSGGGLWLVFGALVAIAMIPKEVWIAIGVVGGVAFAIYLLVRHLNQKEAAAEAARNPPPSAHAPTLAELTAGRRPTPSQAAAKIATEARTPPSSTCTAESAAPQPRRAPGRLGLPVVKDVFHFSPASARAPAEPVASTTPSVAPAPAAASSTPPSAQPSRWERPIEKDEFYFSPASPQTAVPAHALPKAPAGFGDGRWVPPGESVEIAGVRLPGGMVYVGGRLQAPNGDIDPCLIAGQFSVARVGDYRSRHMGYWPSYAKASPEERRAYLNWLSEGRSHPACDIGYVFLFFYGLERRVLIDGSKDPAAKNDWPAIIAELRRLLAIYGEKSNSFNRYAGELLSWLELDGASGQLYQQPVPDFPRTYELPPYLRLALGQAAVDRAPLTADLALAWVRLSPEGYLRTAAIRCPNEFEGLFVQRYREIFGQGLVLPKNRTKLKFVYQAASSGLLGANIRMSFGDVPDVSALTAPIKKLFEIANQCTDELGPYSRLVGKDAEAAGGLDGVLLLPATLWPATTRAKLEALTARMRDGRLSLPLQELFVALGGSKQAATRDRVRSLARALESAEIGMEPHVLGGGRAVGAEDVVVLFAQPLTDAMASARAEYQTAALTLQLASAMAQADGEFHDREIAHLRSEIDAWAHLTPAERRRLHAHLQLLTAAPMGLAALKKKLEPLSTAARETLAGFMATLAQSDGFVSPDEVKFLEKVYKALGVEARRVFSDIHAASAGGAPATPAQAERQGFRLDASRIAALQEDTARVSELLSKIFTEESSTTPPQAVDLSEPEQEQEPPAPLGLDSAHAALLRLLVSRPEWTRDELEDAAADLDLMLDGALEQINEAAFDAFDEPLFEGEDPISVHTDLFEKIEA